MYYIYEEMRSVVLEKKCCILAPYIQLLIQDKIGAIFLSTTSSLSIGCCIFSLSALLTSLPLGALLLLHLLLRLCPLVDRLTMDGRLS
jgi:hypothetical protein